ncbi:unnamed protein product [Caenorhabditis angaria]|uniref:Uncharacterized protein n=1 Tax=Caenorhabditis angaria TaxID=860376 RepID=A0A9P1J1Q6_9PELO|nr:unnamed protein product [Caenorhabditis angaria]
MLSTIKLILLLFCSLYISEGSRISAKNDPIKPEDLDKYKLDEKDFDKVRTIHTNWYFHAMKALISQLSLNLLPKLSPVILKPKKYASSKLQQINSIYQQKIGKLIKKNRVKRSLQRLVVDTVSKSDSNGYIVKNMEKMPDLKSTDSKSTVQKVTDLLKSFVSSTPANQTEEPWSETYNALLNLKKKMSQRENEPGARVYNQRMYDLVMDRKPKKSSSVFNVFDKPEIPGILKKAFDLMSTIDGTGKKAKNSNYKFLR